MTGWEKFDLRVDRTLKACEALLVIFLTAALLGFIAYQITWIVASCPEERIKSTFTMLNENWKVGLLLLVPLFYRTIRMFLERVRKFLGMETREPEEERVEPNPEPAKADQVGQEAEEED
jgi:hypothetical protein